ncbi:MAG: cheA [Firmicutes bacterium]|nr:cheA [Bacillota bacterium]
MDSILEMYLYETNTLLEQLDSIALAAEQAGFFSQNDVDEIFRIMHTIKGSSAMMEFGTLMTVAHRIEDTFFLIREHSMDAVSESNKAELFDLMFQAIDFFRSEVAKLESDTPLSTDIDTFLLNINSLIAKITGDLNGTSGSAAPLVQDGSTGLTTDIPLSSSDEFPYALLVHFDEGSGMENLRAYMLVNSIGDFCVDSDFIYTPSELEGDSSAAEVIIEQGFLVQFRNAADRAAAIHAVTATGSVRTYEIADTALTTLPTSTYTARQEETDSYEETPATISENSGSAAPIAPASSGHTSGKESLISVSLGKLDQLMAVVGEIVITESMVTASPDLAGLKLDNFTKSARQLRKLTDELQDVSMSLRMVPLSGTFQKMNRIVRDMGKKLGKRVNLKLVGEDTEVDKTIVDAISDPIMHIVRNSMDHGIEVQEADRIAAGKNPVGEITLTARHTGSEVIIEVHDDGKGVDYDSVLNKAYRQGLASHDVEYSHKEILNFLLMPGFSTNNEVTEFSGRGVGMDVVKQNVDAVGGSISITSELGQGMTTALKIPLTMAIMDGMEVSVGDSIFTIPINNIRQSFKVAAGDIIYDPNRDEMIKCMDHFYPIIRLKNFYRLENGYDEINDGILIWVEDDEISYCLFVDELIGEHQIVVKPLPPYVNTFSIKNYGITGCTILGDGSISIILDVANLYSSV